MTLKEKAKVIRKQLKEAGIKASVRMGRGSAIDIDIKDLGVSKDRVEGIVRKHERIHRCEYSNEILSGGNDFIFVQYDWEAMRDEREKYLGLAEEILNNRQARYCQTVAEKEGKTFLFFPGTTEALDALVLNTEARQREWQHGAYNKQALAEGLAIVDNVHDLGLLQ